MGVVSTRQRLPPRKNVLLIRSLVMIFATTFVVVSMVTAWVEGWSIADGLYFGVATLTTLGYGDLAPVTPLGRGIVTVLAPVGIILLFGIGLSVASDPNPADAHQERERARRFLLARSLHRVRFRQHRSGGRECPRAYRQARICVVEREADKEVLLEENGLNYVIGDAMAQRTLEDARIHEAACVITTLDKDSDNVYVILEVRDIRRDVKIIATASTTESARKVSLAGAQKVVSPAALAGEMLAGFSMNPDVMDFLSELGRSRDGYGTRQVIVEEGSWLIGKTLRDIGRELPDVRVVMSRHRGQTNIAPDGGLNVEAGMVLLVVASSECLDAMQRQDRTEQAG